MTIHDPAGAAVYAVPALLWAIIAADAWGFRLAYRPRSALYRLLPLSSTGMACFYALYVAIELFLPGQSATRAPRWFDLTDVALLAALALFRHMAWCFPLDATPPRLRWLAVNYGTAALLALLNFIPELIPARGIAMQMTIARAPLMPYVVGMLALSARHLRRTARPGGWRTGSTVARVADVVVMGLVAVAAAGVFVSFALWKDYGPTAGYILPPVVLNAGIGMLVALPFAVRNLGDVAKRFVFALLVLGLCAAGSAGVQVVARRFAPAAAPLLQLGGNAALVFVVLAARPWIWIAIERVLFRRSRRRREELQRFLNRLSPDLGALECCRRAAEEFVRVMQVRGAAVLLAGGRGVATAGEIDAEPLRRVWRDGEVAERLPPRPVAIGTFRELPLPFQEALMESEVFGVIPIVSTRRRWGAAFATAGPLSATASIEDQRAIQGLADQLARILDAAELLERTLAVERSLAHAEKLSALGELSARIAHEIRNPATAAKSLAQQLAREPGSPFREEHEMILRELERIERQVAALLRFARRDEPRLEPVDLDALVESAVGDCRSRLAAVGVETEVTTGAGPVVRADAEKLRQVLLNLLENAADALANGSAAKCVSIRVEKEGGRARIRVHDSGPGVPAEALPCLFEPFFTTRENGTGLGLAIVKRIVEAHGGRISARVESGMTFDIELPLSDTERR